MKIFDYFFMAAVILFVTIGCSSDKGQNVEQTETFTNPIVADGADPWVIRFQEEYYYCFSAENKIWVSRSVGLHEIGEAEPLAVWTPPAGTSYSDELWAPELHYLNGKWYIYVAADNGNNHNHRMYVLEGRTQNPQDRFDFKNKIAAPTDRWAIDGTVLQTDDGNLFFIWSGWEGTVNVQQNLYIAPMSDPWTISGERVKISSPEYNWERIGQPYINEGPEVLKNGTEIFVIYSASGSWTDDYCLGQLRLIGSDPLKKESWLKKDVAVFSKTETVFGPGHASFVKSPDFTQDWIVYHAAKFKGAGWDRDVRMQQFFWNEDGSPNFGVPAAAGVPIAVPSGS